MALKRKANEIEASKEELAFSAVFPVGSSTDLVVEASDGTLFGVRSLYLRAASSVLDDMLGMPAADDQEKVAGHPLLKLDEKADELEAFFRFIHPDRLVVRDQALVPTWELINRLSRVFDKYDASLVARSFFIEHLPYFLGNPLVPDDKPRREIVYATKVFAIAALHGLEDIAKDALRWHHTWGVPVDQAYTMTHSDPADPYQCSAIWRPSGLGDVNVDLLARLPATIVRRYSQLHVKVLTTPGYHWIKAADDFKVSTFRFT